MANGTAEEDEAEDSAGKKRKVRFMSKRATHFLMLTIPLTACTLKVQRKGSSKEASGYFQSQEEQGGR